MTASQQDILQAALKYAGMGLQVFPVKGKRPTTPKGMHNASSNAEVVRSWFVDGWKEGLGIGIVIPSWAVIVDIDGDDGFAYLKGNDLETPATATSKTHKGYQYWYKRAPGDCTARRIKALPNVDILVNGYVVAPPSPHPSGGQYSWEHDLTEDSVTDAPTWIEVMTKHDESVRNKVDPEEFFRGLAEGERQTGLFRYACNLRSRPRMTKVEAKYLVRELAKVSEGTGYGKFPDTDTLVERVWKTYDQAKEQEEREPEVKIYSLADLAAGNWTKSRDVIEQLLPGTGYTLLTSAPKKGKSLIAAYLSACVASGKVAWGEYPAGPCGVLYLDLEQGEADAYHRWTKVCAAAGLPGMPSNLYTAFIWPSMDNGAMEKISAYLVEHPHIGLVVVDTMADLWPEEERGSSSAYHREQRIVRRFLPISREYGCAFLVVHHDKKGGSSESMIDRASGTAAITGKASAIWNFQRKGNQATLEITGKNIPDATIHLLFDRERLFWELTDDPEAEDT